MQTLLLMGKARHVDIRRKLDALLAHHVAHVAGILHMQIAIGRARFLRNRENDIRGNVERTMRYLMEEMTELSMKDTLPEEMEDLFQLNSHEFLDEGSVRFPRQMQSIKEPVVTEIEEMTEEAKDWVDNGSKL